MITHGPIDISTPVTQEKVRRLPFEIHVAITERDISDLVSLRSATYSRHGAPGAQFLGVAEAKDGAADAILLVARSKIDEGVLGSVRIQTRAAGPLMVESALNLPPELALAAPIELMRGSVRGGVSGRTVSAALAKASFLIAVELQFTHVIVTCREPVDLMYRSYQFDDLLNGDMVHLPYSPGAKHRVLSLPMSQAAGRWKGNNPGLHDFMLATAHPDIRLDFRSIRERLASVTQEGATA